MDTFLMWYNFEEVFVYGKLDSKSRFVLCDER